MAAPVQSSRPQTFASGTTSTPELSRPDGGRANGVSLRMMANRNASKRPRTKTGVETPRFAKTIVPTSADELCR